MEALKAVLQQYEECSGQKVNLQKSSIFFGKKCEEENKRLLKNKIGITCEALSERYLGLPTVVGHSQRGAFKDLTRKDLEMEGARSLHGGKGDTHQVCLAGDFNIFDGCFPAK
jgi:hypothetical protein